MATAVLLRAQIESDFENIYGRQLPCFSPLVKTFNDENANNAPNLTEIVEQCENLEGCSPYCLRAGQMCMKYTVTTTSSDKVTVWESHFCGSGTNWNGKTVNSERCFPENKVQGYDHKVCFCNGLSLCNKAQRTMSTNFVILIVCVLYSLIATSKQ